MHVLLLCMSMHSFSYAHASLNLADVKAAFASDEGLTLRVADPGERNTSRPSSTTVWRSDLPLALYGPPGQSPADTAGVILSPGRASVLCAYPVDANTIKRVRADDPSVRDACGVAPSHYRWTGGKNISGLCNFTDAVEYASAYYNQPQVDMLGQVWSLEYGTCHFSKVPDMLTAQKALLQASMQTPPNTTDKEWLINATKIGFGLTAFNEVMVAPYDSLSSTVGAIFWAHVGQFRAPIETDTGACAIAKHLHHAGATLPIFELAGVNLERPFLGCHVGSGLDPNPAPDCLSKGLGEWKANVTGGGRNSSEVIRLVDSASFLALLSKCSPAKAASVRAELVV